MAADRSAFIKMIERMISFSTGEQRIKSPPVLWAFIISGRESC
jgi:hypothetical protein